MPKMLPAGPLGLLFSLPVSLMTNNGWSCRDLLSAKWAVANTMEGELAIPEDNTGLSGPEVTPSYPPAL